MYCLVICGNWSQDFVENQPTVKITGPTDRVYEAAPLQTNVVAKEGILFEIKRDNFKDIVVWNPALEGAEAMADFEPKSEWEYMVILCTYVTRSSDSFALKQAT